MAIFVKKLSCGQNAYITVSVDKGIATVYIAPAMTESNYTATEFAYVLDAIKLAVRNHRHWPHNERRSPKGLRRIERGTTQHRLKYKAV